MNDSFERLLHVIPYLASRKDGASYAEISEAFNTSPRKIIADLRKIWLDCGIGVYGNELIDFHFSQDSVKLVFSAGLDYPLRLSSAEATALIIALDELIYYNLSHEVYDPAVISQLREKIEKTAKLQTLGKQEIERSDVQLPIIHFDHTQKYAQIKSTIAKAIAADKALDIQYYSASSNTWSLRHIDPIVSYPIVNHDYLYGYCHEKKAFRYFRFDRIDNIAISSKDRICDTTLAELKNRPENFDNILTSTALLRISPAAGWTIERYSMDIITRLPDENTVVLLRYHSPQWLLRLIFSLCGNIQLLDADSLATLDLNNLSDDQRYALRNYCHQQNFAELDSQQNEILFPKDIVTAAREALARYS